MVFDDGVVNNNNCYVKIEVMISVMDVEIKVVSVVVDGNVAVPVFTDEKNCT